MSAEFAKPYNYKVAWKQQAGPTSYTSGGFDISLPELKRIHFAVAMFSGARPSNYVYQLDVSWSVNRVRVTVMRIDVTATAPAAWTEVPAGTDLSGLTFSVIAIGE